jgi:hypothetical protein
MTTKNKTGKKTLSEEEIDNLVESQADDDDAWDEPMLVSGKRQASLSLPAELAARAAFLAKLHKEQNTKEWLNESSLSGLSWKNLLLWTSRRNSPQSAAPNRLVRSHVGLQHENKQYA